MATKPMSLRAYAKHRGETLGAVQKALKTGRITALKSGKIDPAAADKAWSQGTDPSKQRKAPGAGGNSSENFAMARAAREAYNAKLAELNFRERAKQLVDAGTVRARAFENARAVRDAVLGLPNKIGAELAAETDPVKVQNLLILELTRVLEELATAASLPEKPPEAHDP
jgi:hypothetical protein